MVYSQNLVKCFYGWSWRIQNWKNEKIKKIIDVIIIIIIIYLFIKCKT